MKISGMRRLAVVAALAVGLLLGLAAMPGCGSGCPTPEQAAYFEKAEDWAKSTEAGHVDLQTILGEVETRTELVLDEGWRGRLKRTLDELDSDQRDITAMEPAGTEEVHRLVLRVAEATIEANELMWQSVQIVDPELLKRSSDRRNEAIPLMEEGIRVMERFCE